jgi:hypothetical protein
MMTDETFEKEEAPNSPGATSPSSASSSPVRMTRTESGGVETEIGKFHVEVEARQLPLVGFFLASFIFMFASIAQKDGLDNWYGYGVSIGVIGMVVGLVGLVLLKYKSEVDQNFLAYFMLVWSIVGACFMTFGSGPFTVTGNGTFLLLIYVVVCASLDPRLNNRVVLLFSSFIGYFAVWAMVIFAVQHCGATQQFKEGVESLNSLTGLGVASIIMVIAISYDVGVKNNKGNSIYTLILSCFTIVLVGGIVYVELKARTIIPAAFQFYTLTVFAIMWIVAACLVTFDGPFVVSENSRRFDTNGNK